MTPGNFALLALFILLVLNQLVLRVPYFLRRPGYFYAVIGMDTVVGLVIPFWGMPGLEKIPIMSMVIGLLMFMHAAQGLRMRPALLEKYADNARYAERMREMEIKAAIMAGEEEKLLASSPPSAHEGDAPSQKVDASNDLG